MRHRFASLGESGVCWRVADSASASLVVFVLLELVSELSGGLRMRVALCMAFIIEPDLLLLDEVRKRLQLQLQLRTWPLRLKPLSGAESQLA